MSKLKHVQIHAFKQLIYLQTNYKATKNLKKTSTVITTHMVAAFVEMHISFLLYIIRMRKHLQIISLIRYVI